MFYSQLCQTHVNCGFVELNTLTTTNLNLIGYKKRVHGAILEQTWGIYSLRMGDLELCSCSSLNSFP